MENYNELYAKFRPEFTAALKLLGAEDHENNKFLELIAIGPYLAKKSGPHRHMVGLIATYLVDLKSDFMDLRRDEDLHQYIEPALYLEVADARGFDLLRARNAMILTYVHNDQIKDHADDHVTGKPNIFDKIAATEAHKTHESHVKTLQKQIVKNDPNAQLSNIVTAQTAKASWGWSP